MTNVDVASRDVMCSCTTWWYAVSVAYAKEEVFSVVGQTAFTILKTACY